MTDKELAALFMATLLPPLQVEHPLVKMARNFQPTQQGAPSTAYVFFHKVMDKRYGQVKRTEVFDPLLGIFNHTETQIYESTYQFSAWVPQDSSSLITESDILNTLSGIIQSDAVIESFKQQDVGLLRVMDVKNPYIVDDRDRFEAVPSFDVVLIHNRSLMATTPVVVDYEDGFFERI